MSDKLNITRRDFLNGVALSLAAGTSLSPLELLAQTTASKPYYPPLLTGLRGSHVGSFEVAHAVAMAGARFGQPTDQTESTYDLVVVGGGISGLSAAHLYQQQHGGDKKVLVLDNHDDFGGHAKRNEFNVDGKTLIGYGGSQSLSSPGQYSPEAQQLIKSIGIETERFYDYFDRSFFRDRGMGSGIYFSREAYGEDRTLPNVLRSSAGRPGWDAALKVMADFPISEESRKSLIDLLSSDKNYLADIDQNEIVDLLRGMSYTNFLRDYVGTTDEVIRLFNDSRKGYWGFGMDALSALEGHRLRMPGTWNLGVPDDEEESGGGNEPYIFHFPDGNAGVARSLVRQLVPGAVPGSTMEDLVTSRVDYSLLDRPSNNTRIRLNATGVDVRHTPDESHVDVTYISGGRPQRVRGRHAILACYNHVIPHIAPELPAAQREAIEYPVKTPLVYISIAVRNWRAMAELGYNSIYIPDSPLMHSFGMDFPVSVGDYSFTSGPDQPTVLHGTYCPTTPGKGLTQKQQHLDGQRTLMEMSFGELETGILRQLDGALAGGGFDSGRDVAALTVNRWPHGYAYEYNDYYDPPEYNPANGPHIQGRAQIGRISIANSDSSAYAYVDGAIDAAVRAVAEQTRL